MQKNLIRFLFLFFIIFIIGFNSYSQNWANNLRSQQLSKGDLNFYDFQNAFYQDYPKDIVKDGYKLVNNQNEKIPYWKLFKRWEWHMESRVDKQTGNFPIKSASQVLQEFNQQRSQIQSTPINGGGSWSNTGPSSNYSGYSGTGRLNCVTFHPSDNNTFWVGSPSGGVWKTTNGGANWSTLTDDNDVLGVSTIALHPNYATNQTLFIGTGDRDGGSMWSLGGGQSNDNNGIGILKSTDDGNTWTSTGLTFTTNQKVSVNEILINQNNASIMIAATSQGIYKSSDGGVSWTLKSNNLEFVDMDFKPGSFSTIYASTSSWSNPKIYKSTDSGENWTEVLSVSGRRIQLAVSSNNASIVYALAANDNRGLEGVYKSTNSGSTFSKIFNGTNTTGLLDYYCDGSGSNEGQGSYDLCLAADPNNADIVFLGGVNTWKSTDGGISWSNSNMWTSSSTYNSCNSPVVHADKHYLIFQNGSSTLFECNDGGIYKTSNFGASWTDITGNMKISQMYRISASASSSTEILCGLQDNGTKRFNSNSWTDVSGGDGMECLIDYSNSNNQYSGVQNGKIYRTTNGWISKTNISDNVPGGQDGAWVSPYVIDPVNNQTLYLGYSEVYKTTDKGDNWTQISNLSVPGKIRSMAIAKSNNQYLYIANHDNIWKTTNGGTSWTDITGSLPTGSNNITYIAIKNNDPNTVWVTFGGYNSLKVYQTINGGSSWTNISAGLPSIPTMSIVQNKQNTTENELYVGTDVGVYQKIGNNNWTPYCTGLPNVVVTELEIYYDANNSDNSKLWAGTFGRGLWFSPLPSLFSAQNPSNLVATTISDSQIDLSWNLNSSGNNILLAVSTNSSFGTPIDGNSYSVGDNLIGGGQVIGVGNITSLIENGLSANTTYYYKIWSNDGTSYSSGLNANATTLCGIITTFPINEGFEGAAIPNCWTTFRGVNNQGTSNDWSIVSSNSNTGIYSAYVQYEAVSNSAEDWMVSSLLDLTNAISASVSYWEKDTYSQNWNSIYKVKVSTNSQTNHSDFIDLVSYSESDMSNTAWTQNTVDLSAYLGQQIYVAFVMTQNNGDDWYLDDIQFSRVQGAGVNADFSVSDSTFCQGTSITFTDLSTGTPTSWLWDFGDGNSSTLQNPTHTYSNAGTYNVSLTVSDGTITETETKTGFTTVSSPVNTQENITACNNYSWNGNTYSISGNYIDTLQTSIGCDSIVTLNLVINSGGNSQENITACNNYTWNGTTYSQSGTYANTLQTVNGCDSIITLNLTINQNETSQESISTCNNYSWNGNTYSQSGTYLDTLQTVNGCDSILTLNLTISSYISSSENIISCNDYTWNGNIYTQSGNYTDTILVPSGCDSIKTLNLVIGQTSLTNQNVTSCGSYNWNGTNYFQSGNYSDTLQSTNGCDSVLNLNLIINSSISTNESVIVCDNYLWNGNNYTQSGSYNDTLVTNSGCDSIVTLLLTVNSSTVTQEIISTCGSYIWHGNTYSQSGTYYDSLSTISGCDSISSLVLSVSTAQQSTDSIFTCNNYLWNGNTYLQSGIFIDTLQTSQGCDSIATLHLTIYSIFNNIDSVSSCQSYTWNGVQYDSSGIYTDTLQTAFGCDSINTLYLTVNDNTAAPLTLELLLDDYCLETFWTVKDSQDSIWYSEGPYDCNPSGGGNQANTTIIKDIYLDENECYTFELNDIYGDGLSASLWNGTDGNWTLEDLNGNLISQGQGDFGFSTSKSFYVSQSTPSFLLEEISSKLKIVVFPNPFSKSTTVKIINGKGPYQFELFDIRGKIIKSFFSNEDEFVFDGISESSGIYWLKIKNQSNFKPIKLVIE